MKRKQIWEMSECELQEGLVGRLLMIRGIAVSLQTQPVSRIVGKLEELRTCLDALELACARAKMYMNAIEKL